MRVLLVSSGSGSRGGGEIFLEYLGKGLDGGGHEVVMWLPKNPRMDELAAKCALFSRVIRTEYRNTYDYQTRALSTCFNWRTSRRIANEWKSLQPDLIHINKQNLEDGLDLLRAARQSGLPSVCTIHLTQTARYLRARVAWLRDLISRWQLSRYDGVLVAVQERRRDALRVFLSGKIRTKTIFNGVPYIESVALEGLRQTKRKELGLADSDLLVLGVGRLVEQKRPLLFLHVAKDLHKLVPDTSFLWVGDGALAEQWQRAMTDHQLQNVVGSVGWQTDVLPYLAAGDLLLHVAEFEGLPFVVIEAMAAGLACAVTRELASEIPLFDKTNVLFVDNIGDMARKLRNPVALARTAHAGRDLVKKELSVKKMIESYEQLYFEAIREKSRALHRPKTHAGLVGGD